MTDLAALSKKLASLKVAHIIASHQVEEEEIALDQARQREKDVLAAQIAVQEVAEGVQQQAHTQIASVVTRCLKSVFGKDTYSFKIDFQKKRGRTEARLLFVRDGEEVNPTEAAGGGVVDVAAFALRLFCLLLSRPRKRKLLVLDEPFRFVSRDYLPEVRGLLLALSHELGVQLILVTHSKELCVGKVIELG